VPPSPVASPRPASALHPRTAQGAESIKNVGQVFFCQPSFSLIPVSMTRVNSGAGLGSKTGGVTLAEGARRATRIALNYTVSALPSFTGLVGGPQPALQGRFEVNADTLRPPGRQGDRIAAKPKPARRSRKEAHPGTPVSRNPHGCTGQGAPVLQLSTRCSRSVARTQ
jgi:hypothetical protein